MDSPEDDIVELDRTIRLGSLWGRRLHPAVMMILSERFSPWVGDLVYTVSVLYGRGRWWRGEVQRQELLKYWTLLVSPGDYGW